MTARTHGQTALIGRDLEVATVVDALDRDQATVVTGEAGIGKTSVIRAAVAVDGRRSFEGGGFATLAWKPYLALARAIRHDPTGDTDHVAAVVESIVGPDVLVIDDLQWVDAETLTVLERLIGRIAMVVASRIDDAEAVSRVTRLTGAGVARLDLGPLETEHAAAIARRSRPGLSTEAARRITERAGGNPLLIEQLAAGGESESLRLAVAARLHGLDAGQRERLGLLALAARPLLPHEIDGDVRDLLARGLAIDTETEGLSIRHALLAEVVVESLDDAVRARLHARLATTATGPGERARHLFAAGDRDGAHAAAKAAVAAAATPGERAAHLGLAAQSADGSAGDDLRVAAAGQLRLAGELEAATALLDGLSTTDPEVLGRADAIRARVAWSSGDSVMMRETIDRGLARVRGRGSVAEAMLRAEEVVVTALVDGRFEEGLRDVDAALSLAEHSGADRVRPLLLRATILAGLGRDGWEDALEAVIAAARTSDDIETELAATNNLVAGHEMHGRPDAGRAVAAAMHERAHDVGYAAWERQAEAMMANLDLHAGELDAAIERASRLLDEPLDPLATQQAGLIIALGLIDQGRFEEASPLLDRLHDQAADDVSARGDVLLVQAELALWLGRPALALRIVDDYRRYEASEYGMSFLVDVIAGWAAIELEAEPPPRIAHSDPVGMLVGARLERDAIDRSTREADAATASAFDDAAAAYVGYHRRGELRARWAAADIRRRCGDADTARAALEDLEREASAQGFGPLLVRIHRSLRLSGVRRTSPSVGSRSVGAGGRLTAREREIVRHVTAGASNVEIARRLGLGRPTVARLLGSAMDKLGVDSRAQVAAQAEAE